MLSSASDVRNACAKSGVPSNAGALDPRTVDNLMAKSAVSSLGAIISNASGHRISGGFADYRARV